jgi:hypothetical protein
MHDECASKLLMHGATEQTTADAHATQKANQDRH